MIKRSILSIVTCFLCYYTLIGCQYTIREIGFSIIAQDIYNLVVIDRNADASAPKWESYRKDIHSSNIRILILNPLKDKQHPIVLAAQKAEMTFPTTVLTKSNHPLFSFSTKDFKAIYNEVKTSKIRTQLLNYLCHHFAVIVHIDGTNRSSNKKTIEQIRKDCDTIKNLMPTMPKVVRKAPLLLRITSENFTQERILLWSLGVTKRPKEPIAYVLYGRGRLMGKALSKSQIEQRGVYKYLSMIGSDCECGLDRRWMLGHQIPLQWDKKTRQILADEIMFDVDNPLVLAEMSRILSKDELETDAVNSISFAPEVIDVETLLNTEKPQIDTDVFFDEESQTKKTLIYSFIGFLLFVLFFSWRIFMKQKK